MIFPVGIRQLATETLELLREKNMTIATAESCTGGLIAGALTEIAGSSDVVYGGFVTYANAAKITLLGVAERTLLAHGAVSEQTAWTMAEGARAKTGASLAIAVTGVAGPGGGSAEKPIGLVYIACANANGTVCEKHLFGDIGRGDVRAATIVAALRMVCEIADDS